MNRSNKLLLLTIFALAAAGPVIAQQYGTTNSNTSNSMASSASQQSQASSRTMSTIVGINVNDAQGKKLGAIKDLVVDQTNAQIDYAIVNVGGVMGVASKHLAVPWKSLQLSADGKSYALNVDRDALKNAPSINISHWSEQATTQWLASNSNYWQGVTKTSSGSDSNSGSSGSK